MNITFNLMTFEDNPRAIAIEIEGAFPPKNDDKLVELINLAIPHATDRFRKLIRIYKQIRIKRNNDPKYPKDKLGVIYIFKFNIHDDDIKAFAQALGPFIVSYYGIDKRELLSHPE